MLPTAPSDLDFLPPWIAQDAQEALRESRHQAQQICAEATAACATAAGLRHETAQLRHRAQQMRAVHAQHLAAGVRRRQPGLARE
jgi:hypothetical protein